MEFLVLHHPRGKTDYYKLSEIDQFNITTLRNSKILLGDKQELDAPRLLILFKDGSYIIHDQIWCYTFK